jgi:hypothetical protein
VPAKMANNGKVDVGALWTDPEGDPDALHAGHVEVGVSRRHAPLATAAPGVQ